MNDINANSKLTREELEALIALLFENRRHPRQAHSRRGQARPGPFRRVRRLSTRVFVVK